MKITKHDHWQSSNTDTILLKSMQAMPGERIGAHAKALLDARKRYQPNGKPKRIKRLRTAWLQRPAGLSSSGTWRSK